MSPSSDPSGSGQQPSSSFVNPLSEVMDDLRDRLVARLERDGFEVPAQARIEVDRALMAVLRVAHRSIPARPRKVHWSGVLRDKLPGLDPNTRAAVQTVVVELETGVDVNQRQTRQHYKAAYNDRLRNDLHVRHLNLGPRDQDRDKTKQHLMAGGSSDLLWIVAAPDDVYLIDVLDHDAFGTFDFPQVIYDNWKHLLGDPAPGCTVDEKDALSAADRAKARKAGLHTAVAINGQMFLPGGIMADGTSSRVVSTSNDILNGIVDLYRWLEANAGLVLDGLAESTGERPPGLRLKAGDLDLLLRGGVALAEANTGGVFLQGRDGIRFGYLKQAQDVSSSRDDRV